MKSAINEESQINSQYLVMLHCPLKSMIDVLCIHPLVINNVLRDHYRPPRKILYRELRESLESEWRKFDHGSLVCQRIIHCRVRHI